MFELKFPAFVAFASTLCAAALQASPALAETASTPVPSAAPCACAPEAPSEPVYRSGSLLMRFSLGPGYLIGMGDPDTQMKGVAASANMAVGAFVVDSLALHADVSWLDALDPDFSASGTIDASTSATLQAGSFHLGASYYLASLRAYASLGVGVGIARLTGYVRGQDDAVALMGREYAKVGPSLQVQLGKEWPVGRAWGMGVGLEYEFISVEPRDDDGNVTIDVAHHVGLRFSATFAGS